MNSHERQERDRGTRRCAFAWCVTDHGSTVHPDDEDHRSAGVGWSARVRAARAHGAGELADVEVGLLRRTGDSETWIVVESGIGPSFALPVPAARALGALLRADGWMARLLESESESELKPERG